MPQVLEFLKTLMRYINVPQVLELGNVPIIKSFSWKLESGYSGVLQGASGPHSSPSVQTTLLIEKATESEDTKLPAKANG